MSKKNESTERKENIKFTRDIQQNVFNIVK